MILQLAGSHNILSPFPKDMNFNLFLELGHVLNKLTQIITILLINFTDFGYCIFNIFYSCISNLILLYTDFNDFCKFVVFQWMLHLIIIHWFIFCAFLHYADKHGTYEKSRENPAFLSGHHWCANIRGIILPAARLVFILALSYKHAVLIQSRLY
jgi:hypothetical protein